MSKRDKVKKRRLKFIQVFDRLFKNKYCWADCVSWAFNGSLFSNSIRPISPFKIDSSESCRKESEGWNTCYCGRFCNGFAFDELSKEEQQKNISNRE